MKRLRILRRWFARKFGYARLVCLALLIGLVAVAAAIVSLAVTVSVQGARFFDRKLQSAQK